MVGPAMTANKPSLDLQFLPVSKGEDWALLASSAAFELLRKTKLPPQIVYFAKKRKAEMSDGTANGFVRICLCAYLFRMSSKLQKGGKLLERIGKNNISSLRDILKLTTLFQY